MSSHEATDGLERYRLEVEVEDGANVQLVRNSAGDVEKRQIWQRRRRLGKGGFGEVWQEAWENQHGDWHYRAVKTCSEADTEAARKYHQRELSALAAFSRSEYAGLFVNMYGWWNTSRGLCVAMEYLGNGDLSRYAADGIPEMDIKEIAENVLRGLDVMHGQGFTHRDLKPQNILVVQKRPEHHRWWVKIADFGLSKQTFETGTALRTLAGTQLYCAPEILGFLKQRQQTSIYNSKVDMWSFGCVLYNLVSGDLLPFSDLADVARYCAGLITFNFGPSAAHLSGDLKNLVEALLQVHPDRRPTATEALRSPWLGCLGNESIGGDGTVSGIIGGDGGGSSSRGDTGNSNDNGNDSGVGDNSQDGYTEAPNGCDLLKSPLRNYNSFLDSESSVAQSVREFSRDAENTTIPFDTHKIEVWFEKNMDAVRQLLKSLDGENTATSEPSWREVSEAAMFVAIKQGELEIVRMVTMQSSTTGADLEKKDEKTMTPLIRAAYEGHLEIVKCLIMHGAKTETKTQLGDTALSIAAACGHLEVVRCLVGHGADIHTTSNDKLTPLHDAAGWGQLEVVKWLITHGADVHAMSIEKVTPLHSAAISGQLEVVKWLVTQGALLEAKTQGGLTPLYSAAAGPNLDVLEWLIQHSANMEIECGNDSRPLLHAIVGFSSRLHAGTSENCKKLYPGITDHNDKKMHVVEVIKCLVRHGARLEATSSKGWTVLHQAVTDGELETIKLLVDLGANLNAKTAGGQRVLHIAAQRGHLDVVKWLVLRGADIRCNDAQGRTPLQLAHARGHEEIKQWLKEQQDISERTVVQIPSNEKIKQRSSGRIWKRLFS